MKICITGACGHIGSALIRDLSGLDLEKVYLIDNFQTRRYASVRDLPDIIPYYFYEMDILSSDIEPIIADSDVVIHLAAITDAETSFYKTEKIEEINKKGLAHVAGVCAREGSSLIFPSSTSVYGTQKGLVDENCAEENLKPQSPYAASKLYGEKLLQSMEKEKGLKFVIFRLGTIFGYSIGMRFHTAVNKFIQQAVLGQDLTVWKTAFEQKRPYCDLTDCIGAVKHVIKNNIFDSEIYNIATTNLTVREVIDTIRRHVPGLNIQFVDSPIMNQLSYEVSIKKSIEKGFQYHGNLSDGIRKTVQKLKEQKSS